MAAQRGARKTKAVRKSAKAAKKPAQRLQQTPRTSAARIATSRAKTANAHEGVRYLLTRYCHALDRGNLAEVGALFHHDATFAVSFEGGQHHTGRETIQAWYERFFNERPGEHRHMRHKIFEPMVSVHGTNATASTYFDADSVAPDGSVRVIAGRYDDTLMKEQGQWFFKERTITVLYHYSPGSCQEGM